MLSKSLRFKGLHSLDWTYRHSRTFRNDYFTIKFAYNKQISRFRLAVVVSRKINHSAVIRNKIRRRLFEAFGEFKDEITDHVDLICIINSASVIDLSYREIENQVKYFLVKNNLLKN